MLVLKHFASWDILLSEDIEIVLDKKNCLIFCSKYFNQLSIKNNIYKDLI